MSKEVVLIALDMGSAMLEKYSKKDISRLHLACMFIQSLIEEKVLEYNLDLLFPKQLRWFIFVWIEGWKLWGNQRWNRNRIKFLLH